MNLQMEGASYEGSFVIADIRIDLPLPTERLAYFDPAWNPGNTILMHREPHGIWRVDYQLPAGETPEQALQPESLKPRIDAQLAMIGHAGCAWEMDWASVYSARTLTLPDYVQGPRALRRRRGAPAADLRRARRQHRLPGCAIAGLAPGLRGEGPGAPQLLRQLQPPSGSARRARSSRRRARAPAS